MLVFDGDGRHRGEVAVARALAAAGPPWSVIGRMLLTRNRHRLTGGTAACRVPPAP